MIVGQGDACPALFFLDGAFIGNASYVELEYVLGVNQIEAVEAYNGPSQMPVFFNLTGSQCGVVAFWTRRYSLRRPTIAFTRRATASDENLKKSSGSTNSNSMMSGSPAGPSTRSTRA